MDDELAVLNQSVLTEEFILPLPEHSDSAVQGELLTLQQTFLIPHTSISSDQEDAHNENFDSDDEKFAIYHGEQATDDYAEGKEEADDDTDADIAIEVEEDSEVLDEAAGSHQQQPRCRTCKKGECLEALGEHVVHKNRQRWKRLNRSQKRLAAQALLSSSIHRHAADHKRRNRSSKPASAVQARLRVDYNFLGVRLCRDAFSYVTTMGERGIKNILADLREDVSIPNPSRQGKNVKGIQHPRTKAVVAFVLEVAYKEGWQNPGNRGPVIFLPLTHTKKEMYGRYKSIPNPSHELVSFPEFCWVWRKYLRHISATNTRTDVCNVCIFLRTTKAEPDLVEHLSQAFAERRFSNAQVLMAKERGWHAVFWGFAEACRLPHFTEQPQSFYFKSGLKLDLFGIANQIQQMQDNYIISELNRPQKKGANLVVSLVHHYLSKQQSSPGLFLSADNCGGQNKNKTMLQYLCLRSAIYKQDVYYHFLVQGHTRGYNDGAFGVIKRCLRTSNIYTPQQFQQMIETTNHNTSTDAASVVKRDYDIFFQQLFNGDIRRISTMRHFFFSKDRPGFMQYRTHAAESWNECYLLRPDIDVSTLTLDLLEAAPASLQHELSAERKAQLADIRDRYLLGEAAQYRQDFFPEENPPNRDIPHTHTCPQLT
eukprot:m.219664 g.219664  ORF g.219664 m.219664 type:complete len:653 (-) comp17003_c5_seq2:239-2197(-)